MEKTYSLNLDVLRTIAVLSVLVFHFFPSYAPWGFIGVDIFIFLSGYLLERKLAQGQSVSLFLQRRFVRIYSTLIVFLSIFLLLGFLLLLRDEFIDFLQSSSAVLFSVSNIYQSTLNGYFDGGSTFRPLLHTWSLSVEIHFYILIAFSYLLLSKPGFRIALFFVTILFSFLYSVYTSDGSSHYFSTTARLWEFMLGALCFHLNFRQNSWLGVPTVLISIGISIISVDSSSDYPGYLAALPLIFSWGMLNVNLSFFWTHINRLFRFIASISYSLFLIHYPLLSMLHHFIGQPSIFDRIAILILSFLLAWFVEGVIVRRVYFLTNFKGVLVATFLLLLALIGLRIGIDSIERPVDKNNTKILEFQDSFKLAPIESCGFNFDVNVDERCRFSPVTHGDVLLLGDSIAHSLSPALDLLKTNDDITSYRLVGIGECPPFLNTGSSDCNAFWSDALSSIKPAAYDSIVVSGQWPLYFDGLSPETRTSRAEGFLFELSEFLADYPGNVIFIGTPPLGARPRSCIDRVPLLIKSNCNINLERAENRRVSQKQLINVVQGIDRIKIFDPFSSLCNNSECVVKFHDRLLYLDDSHFSIEGANLLSEQLFLLIRDK